MAGRRGNNEGLIRKRVDGRWEARITLEDGKTKSFYARTRGEVAQQLTQALQEQKLGMLVLDERQTVGQYLETWVETVQYQIRPSSWRRYKDYVKHFDALLGKVVLARLTPQQVQVAYTRMLREGLSTTTVHNAHGALHRALKDALHLGLVQRNVTEMVQAPRKGHREMMALTPEQSHQFLAAVAGSRFEALYYIALTTGMREGELLGLRWQDVDFEGATLQVRMSVQEDGSKFVLAEPKTAYSRRSIWLSRVAVEALQRHRIFQANERQTLGSAWNDSLNLIFPNTLGGLMIPDNLRKRNFKRFAAQIGLPKATRFHDLRHTAATILISRGVNIKVVSEMLGHADVSITLRVYAHVTPNMQKAAADVMDVVFGEAGNDIM